MQEGFTKKCAALGCGMPAQKTPAAARPCAQVGMLSFKGAVAAIQDEGAGCFLYIWDFCAVTRGRNLL